MSGDMIGREISHYRIIGKIGAGGMGVVYRAEDTKLKRTVALKFLTKGSPSDDEEKRRFMHEAQAAALLDHPNICTIYEIEDEGDETFISMAFIEGKTLSERIKSGPVPVEEAIEIALQIAEGLCEAHERGIIHRDIKPSNIMITEKGRVKVTDFGLARVAGATKLTTEGTTLGTVSYMSPEQTAGESVDSRTDIWSLGVILYEMLTGQLPFRGDYDQAVLYSILNERHEPISSLRSGMPLELEIVLDKILEKDPKKRYGHVDELITDLLRIRSAVDDGSTRTIETHTGGRRKRWYISVPFLAPMVLIIALMISLLIYYPRDAVSFAERDWILIADIENLTDEMAFDKALNEAITIDIQQSHWVNVFDRGKIEQTLRRMERENGERIDESLGLEICKREGISAMLVPKISHVADTYSLSASIVDVGSGARLSPIRVTVTGKDEVLMSAIDDLSRRIRKDLGESMQSIEKSDKSLAKVTTSSLAALEQYTLGREKHHSPQSWEEVMVFYKNAVEIDSTFATAYAAIGTVYNNLGRTVEAKKYYEKSFEHIDNLTDRERYRIMAEYYNVVKDDPTRAMQIYTSFLEQYPDDSAARNNLGLTYAKLGRYDDAEATFRETLRIDPYHMVTYNNLVILYTDLGRYDEAIEAGRECNTVDPDYSVVYNFIGIAYGLQGQTEMAVESYRKCLSLDPDNYWSFYLLGDSYTTLGRYDEAVKEIERALRIDPENYHALAAMVRVHSLRGDKETALDYLSRAVDGGYADYDYVKSSSDLDNIRDDRRFGEILIKIKDRSGGSE
jgi:serine/threonine protein kinase/tetratricopeptide (TPR) repeat protein